MIKKIKIIFIAMFIAIICGVASAQTNTPNSADIGNYGAWTTEHNLNDLTTTAKTDIEKFQGNFQTQVQMPDYVPIEARLGNVLIRAMEKLGVALQRSLFDFIQIFLLVLFAFWVIAEAYNLIQSRDGDAKKLAPEVAKKLLLISAWIWVLANSPGQIFMTIFGPIVSVATYASDIILNAITTSAGASLPDTCAAIKTMTGDGDFTADLLCMPTRLSGFFYTCIAAGFRWIWYGFGHSALTLAAGVVFVIMFLINLWKFTLLALGVIVDLFLCLMLLPFTAITECFGSGTGLKGIGGDLFKGFAGLFNGTSLQKQIMRFISAAIYFIVLSVIAAIGAGLLGGVVNADMLNVTPSVENDGFMTTLIIGFIVMYLVNKATSIAEGLSGKIDGSFGETMGKYVSNAWKSGSNWITTTRKIFNERKKK
ncbi:MAG: hypothetical protein LBL75_01100 [Rickettsiales bacterium]|jgi:hypothetical protein|nr:hypothetical protein [Rickettsiales bacterium]